MLEGGYLKSSGSLNISFDFQAFCSFSGPKEVECVNGNGSDVAPVGRVMS